MGRLASLVALACLAPGCFLVFDGEEQDCPLVEPTIAEAPLRNPDTLQCESFGNSFCEDPCGICPAVGHTPPLPSWGVCGDPCEQLNESDCAAASRCRVVKDASCLLHGECLTDFIGCFPTDQQLDPSIDCDNADAFACSRNPACTALHAPPPACLDEACPMRFAMCVPEGTHPGTCWGEASCDEPAPVCPSGTTPGIEAGCYSGSCIPLELCGPVP